MSAAHDTTPGSRRRRGLTPAQWYCLLVGLSLLLAGAFGFLADASFDTGGTADTDRIGNADGQLQGDGFLGFEVNAWHNIVHLLSGLVLLAAFRRRGPAKTVALAFGVVWPRADASPSRRLHPQRMTRTAAESIERRALASADADKGGHEFLGGREELRRARRSPRRRVAARSHSR